MSRNGPSLRRDANGYAFAKFNGKKIHFGRFDDPKAQDEFDRFRAQWLLNGRALPDEDEDASEALTVEQLAAGYLSYLQERHDELWQANNYGRYQQALKPMRDLFGELPAASFSPTRLERVRHAMIDAKKLCRQEVNYRVRAIRRAFKWATARELIPASVSHGLASIEALREGDYGVREGREIGPVDEATVWATLPHLPKPVRALVELLWWTGARPSELFGLRPSDIDRSGKVWSASLPRHKTAKRGKQRRLFFGPQAQRVMRRFLMRPAERPMFSPAEAVAERDRQRRAARKTPLWPSHVARYERERRERPDRNVGDRYTALALRKAVERAVKAANRTRAEKGLEPLPSWTPYQLRHAAATRIRKEHGLEMVRVLLGHTSARMSEVYAEADLEKARSVMEEAG